MFYFFWTQSISNNILQEIEVQYTVHLVESLYLLPKILESTGRERNIRYFHMFLV